MGSIPGLAVDVKTVDCSRTGDLDIDTSYTTVSGYDMTVVVQVWQWRGTSQGWVKLGNYWQGPFEAQFQDKYHQIKVLDLAPGYWYHAKVAAYIRPNAGAVWQGTRWIEASRYLDAGYPNVQGGTTSYACKM